ncbi:hypothetical protein [Streptomyces sp. NPDC094149]|uniref:hypothetical protein n=1 Tax=Streptomyces sp. NPDC094149 TaxID=3155079 RepID=UPI003323E6CF
MTGRPAQPHLQPTVRMWQILRRCYPGQNPVTVLGRALDMLAGADGHLNPDGTLKAGLGGYRTHRSRP